jgi:predicted ATP-dependent endonuclease of OLD family
LRALLDFHPTVCEAFFAKRAVLVEGDTELAVLVAQPDLYKLAGIDPEVVRDTSVICCDGKWTIIPMARILAALGVPVRVIHDRDRKGRSDEELAKLPTGEFSANARIGEVVGREAVHVVDDTFEDLLWPANERTDSSRDKPYRAWRRVHQLCAGSASLDHAPGLRDAVQFAFAPFS